MTKCKLCKNDIEEDVTFKSLFIKEIMFHQNCLNSLKINTIYERIPTDFGHFNYTSNYLKTSNDVDQYFEKISYGFYYDVLIKQQKYDIYIIINRDVLSQLNHEEVFLISALSSNKILFISLFYINLFDFENIFH